MTKDLLGPCLRLPSKPLLTDMGDGNWGHAGITPGGGWRRGWVRVLSHLEACAAYLCAVERKSVGELFGHNSVDGYEQSRTCLHIWASHQSSGMVPRLALCSLVSVRSTEFNRNAEVVMFLVGLLIGLISGVGATCAFVITGDRIHPRLRLTVSRMLLGQQSCLEPTTERVIQDLRQQDPAFAAVVESEPAVSVTSVPETVPHTAQSAIEAAPSHHAATETAARFIRDPDLRDVVVTLVRWRTRPDNTESQYQNSFTSHAAKSGYKKDRLRQKERIPWAGGGGSRIAIPDLILGGRVLVELKAGLTSSGETDRAMGQMLRYLLAWKASGPAVLAICGRVSPEIRWLVLTYVNTWRSQLNLPVMVFFKQGHEGFVDGDRDAEMPLEPPKVAFEERQFSA